MKIPRQLDILIVLLCLFSLCIPPARGQQRDTQKEYHVDSTLYVYYLQCKSEIKSPRVMKMADTLFIMAKKKNDPRMQAVALSTKLDYYYYQNNQDSIIHYAEIVKSFARKTKQPQYYYFAWSKRLIMYYVKQYQYNIALYETNRMMHEAEEERYVEGMASAYNILSAIYQSKKRYNLATENKEKEMEIILKYNLDKYNLTTTYTALANLYCTLGNADKALEYLNKAKSGLYSSSQELSYYICAARYHLFTKDDSKAWKFLEKARNLLDTKKEVRKYIEGYYEILNTYYIKTEQYEKALQVQKYITSTFPMTIKNRLKVTLDYASIYYRIGDMHKAAQYYNDYHILNDSIQTINENITTGEFSAILGVERLKLEKSELQQQMQQRDLTNKQRIIIFLIAILAIGIIFLYREHFQNDRLRTSQKQLSDKNNELLSSQEALKIAKEHAEDGSRMKSEFIQNMSHEIRTPLNSIVGFSQILSSYFSNDEDTREYARIIEQNSANLMQLINDVLDLSYLDGEYDIPAETIADITGICQTCIDKVRSQLKPEVQLIYVPERENFAMQTNPNRISQILMNLLQNAAKFTKQGSITLSYHIREEEKTILFNVTDTGIGVPLHKQKDIFERFVKLDTFVPGTGLGLSISRLVAEKMNGSLTIDSSYITGSRFILTLPLQS